MGPAQPGGGPGLALETDRAPLAKPAWLKVPRLWESSRGWKCLSLAAPCCPALDSQTKAGGGHPGLCQTRSAWISLGGPPGHSGSGHVERQREDKGAWQGLLLGRCSLGGRGKARGGGSAPATSLPPDINLPGVQGSAAVCLHLFTRAQHPRKMRRGPAEESPGVGWA